MKETFEVKCPKCKDEEILYTTLKGVEYSKKHNVVCKECKKKLETKKRKCFIKEIVRSVVMN